MGGGKWDGEGGGKTSPGEETRSQVTHRGPDHATRQKFWSRVEFQADNTQL